MRMIKRTLTVDYGRRRRFYDDFLHFRLQRRRRRAEAEVHEHHGRRALRHDGRLAIPVAPEAVVFIVFGRVGKRFAASTFSTAGKKN